jgi:predicted nuclease of predicted toxin-antitoxin system
MKFFVDANLPFKLALNLRIKGFDALHTDDLPNKERTKDKEIRKVSTDQDRIVITKDSDFLDSHLIQGIPSKLLFITTGNIINKDLLKLIEKYFKTILQLFEIYDLIEINNEEIIGHEK